MYSFKEIPVINDALLLTDESLTGYDTVFVLEAATLAAAGICPSDKQGGKFFHSESFANWLAQEFFHDYEDILI